MIKGSCLATKKVFKKNHIGYAYRESPSPTNPVDTGWRFFYGDEDEAYCSKASNIRLYDIKSILNIDESVIWFLDAPEGTRIVLSKDGKWSRETD